MKFRPEVRWLSETTRWGQVNFSEVDTREFDLDGWRRHWKECDLQGITVTAGGPVAYYPSEIPGHRPAAWAHVTPDLFGDVVGAAKADGYRVLARLDPWFMSEESFAQHPDRAMRDSNGEALGIVGRRPSVADDETYVSEFSAFACYNSPHFSEYLPAVMNEVLDRYDVDGFFTNAWPRLGLLPPDAVDECRCTHCSESWRAASNGLPFPERADPADPRWRTYVQWVQQSVERAQSVLRQTVIDANPSASFVSTAYPSSGTGLRWDRWIDLVDALGSDAQGRRNPDQPGAPSAALWEAGQSAELHRAVAQGKPIMRFLAGYAFQQHRHAGKPASELRLQMYESLAHGEYPKWHVLGGDQRDRRWLVAAKDVNAWMKRVQSVMVDRQSVADVGILWSPRSVHLDYWETGKRPEHGLALNGWYEAMMSQRLAFDFVHEADLAAFENYRVLVLPSGLVASAALRTAISEFRASGGRVITMCDALRSDEWGQPHPSDVVGAGEPVFGPLEHSHVEVTDSKSSPFPLPDAGLLAGGAWVQRLQTDAYSAGRWVPDYPFHPTHSSFPSTGRADTPIFVADKDLGAVGLAMDFDAAFARNGLPDHRDIMISAVRTVLGDSASISVLGDGLVDVRLWRTADTLSVWLVNLDTPGLRAGYAESPRPLGPLTVTIAAPTGMLFSGDALALSTGEKCENAVSEGRRVTFVLPRLDEVETVALELVKDRAQ